MNTFAIATAKAELAGQKPHAILTAALDNFANIALAFSGAEDVVLIDMALQIRRDLKIFCLDTGRLHPQTYEFIDQVRKHYGINIELLSPDRTLLEPFVQKNGLFSFYQDGHGECCAIRKTEPMRRKLATVDAWISGQRHDQSLYRQEINEVEIDNIFSTPDQQIIKFNPLLNWNSTQVWDYITAQQVPFNTLHQQGYISIGCQPCTRPVLPNQHERAGRWWWENDSNKECGLHQKN